MAEFPFGVRVAGATIVEVLYGGPDRGIYRAAPQRLVTVGPLQRASLQALYGSLAMPSPGITPLLGFERIVGEGVPYEVMIEAEPAGTPVAVRPPGDLAGAIRDLVTCVVTAHRSGLVLGAIRPELVYADGRFTALAPRCEAFLSTATPRTYGVPPCFEEVYLSPEAIALAPATAASDVFSLAATIAFLLTRTPPFAGNAHHERMSAALHGRTSLRLPDIVRAGLHPDPARRPPADALRAAGELPPSD
ncbi:MAG TPA: hypothetical protein VK427_05175 [Kofleriaceae bacterium]|nr:hypothetical protein [Kofleriaceae bacterium]